MKNKAQKPLTATQRATLSAVAAEAFKRLQQGLSETFDQFRRSEARSITRALPGAPAAGWSISEAPASSFNALFSHFKALKGDSDVALDYQLGPSSEMRNLLHNITIAERAASVKPAYTAAICRRMFGVDAPADDRQALAILTALKNKARQDEKLRKGEEVAA